MKFKSKLSEAEKRIEHVHDPLSGSIIAEIKFNVFETEDPKLIERLIALGYEYETTPEEIRTFNKIGETVNTLEMKPDKLKKSKAKK